MNHYDHDPTRRAYVDVTIVEFAAHTAYLDLRAGTGYLVTPNPETDVPAPEDPLVWTAWSDSPRDPVGNRGLSLHDADRQRAFDHLRDEGWQPLLDEQGDIEPAGWTTDGRMALCLYGTPTAGSPCLETLNRSLAALDIAADLGPRSRHGSRH